MMKPTDSENEFNEVSTISIKISIYSTYFNTIYTYFNKDKFYIVLSLIGTIEIRLIDYRE